MSRSYKKISICGNTKKESDKVGKTMISKRLRAKEKRNISRCISLNNFEDFSTTLVDSISKYSYLSKDGKQYLNINDFDDRDYFRKCIQK